MVEDVAAASVSVEVAYAEPGRQFLRRIDLPNGASVADAIVAFGVATECAIDTDGLDIGIWSRHVTSDALVAEGDRVELYRPLTADPKESRRRRAARARKPGGGQP